VVNPVVGHPEKIEVGGIGYTPFFGMMFIMNPRGWVGKWDAAAGFTTGVNQLWGLRKRSQRRGYWNGYLWFPKRQKDLAVLWPFAAVRGGNRWEFQWEWKIGSVMENSHLDFNNGHKNPIKLPIKWAAT
jgi:hypothetical protein